MRISTSFVTINNDEFKKVKNFYFTRTKNSVGQVISCNFLFVTNLFPVDYTSSVDTIQLLKSTSDFSYYIFEKVQGSFFPKFKKGKVTMPIINITDLK